VTTLKKFVKFVKINNYHSHFAVELLLLLITVIIVGANLFLKTDASARDKTQGSLLFSYLKENPNYNEPLLDVYGTINVKVTKTGLLAQRQVLAASTKNKTETEEPPVVLPTLAGTALLKPNPSSSGSALSKKDVEVYQVRGGDTVSRIALSYGVSVDTILWENNLTSTGNIKPGQELKILPTSGVRHVVKDGETISGIAQKYGVHSEDILEYNQIEIEAHIFPGEEIIIPGGTKKAPPTPARQQYLAELQRQDVQRADVPADFQGAGQDLVWPVPGTGRISQYYWSRHRALDIPCRDCQIVSSADGIVELSGWQGGYGNTIVVNHGGGLKTRYAHGSANLVSAGDTVQQGQAIMISGSTGRSTGPHLHFEITQNGVLLNPLPLVQ
jgi:murein DD-endopeptidase MepM/ murein hydrolase activator NlpD